MMIDLQAIKPSNFLIMPSVYTYNVMYLPHAHAQGVSVVVVIVVGKKSSALEI
jgi:hypothetical protein